MMSRVHCLFRSTLRHPRLPKIWARALLWWSGFLKMRVEPPKHSLCRTADLRGELRFRIRTLTHLVYPSAGGLHSSVDSCSKCCRATEVKVLLLKWSKQKSELYSCGSVCLELLAVSYSLFCPTLLAFAYPSVVCPTFW